MLYISYNNNNAAVFQQTGTPSPVPIYTVAFPIPICVPPFLRLFVLLLVLRLLPFCVCVFFVTAAGAVTSAAIVLLLLLLHLHNAVAYSPRACANTLCLQTSSRHNKTFSFTPNVAPPRPTSCRCPCPFTNIQLKFSQQQEKIGQI